MVFTSPFLSAHEWIDIYRVIQVGGLGAFVGAIVGGFVGYRAGESDRFEKMTWGALIGTVIGGIGLGTGSTVLASLTGQ